MKRSLVVDVSGKPGVAGHHGKSGSDGRSGHNGSSGGTGGDGTRGESGGDGTNGGHGDVGTNGQNAENIIVTIEGLDHKSITVTGSANDSLCLDDGSVRSLVFLANGGDGGDGGDGGRGGDGGHGGDGGDGGRGRNGADGCGGDGGDGGDGGKGGNGGDGGNGANGGNGGNGGKIIIETHNPSLLKFVQSECLGGKKGNGGQCGSAGKLGKGGCEGKGGRGGSGGSPPYNDGEYSGSYGKSGSSGNNGYPGKNGTPGKTGSSGEDGNYGVDGSIEYVVYDPANQVVDRGSSVFDLVVDSFQLTAVEDDGIFEPGEDVYVSNVTITNRGGLTLPVGSVISFPTTSGEHTFLSSGSCYVLQRPLSPGERFIIPFQFNGCILDIPEVNPSILGDFQATLPIQSLATLLTSPFKTSLKNEYNIEYPVKIESIKIPPNLGRDETGIVTITFENISQINYGCDEKTRLKYSLVFDPKILVHNEPNLNGSNRIEEELPMIPPGSTYSRIFQIEISELQYFEIVPIKASLFLRGKRIENAESEIKLIPKFTPIANRTENPFDILFFTNGHIQKDEFSCYLKIFNGLDLKVNVWDIERYNGASYLKETGERHPDSWINGGFEGKMIILPMNDNTDDQLLDTSDIFRLLRGTNWRMDNNHPTNGSILFIGTTVASNFRKRLSKNVSETQIPKTELKEMLIIKSPKKEHLEKKVDKYIRNLLKNSKNRIIEPSNLDFFPLEGKGFSTTLGSAYYKELPLTVSDNLFFVSPNKNSPLSFLSEDKQDNLNCNQFKVNSNFGRLFYSVILALPLEKKLKLLRKPTDWLKKITFKEGNGVIVSYVNSIVLSLNYYLFLEFIYKEEIGRYTNIILKDFESNFQDYFNSPNCKLIVESLYHVIAKLRKDLKWRGMLLSKSKGNKEAFSKFCKSFQKILFSLLDSSTVDYIKKETKEMIENCKVKQFIVEKLDFVQRPLIDGYHQKFESDISKDVFDTFKKETHLK